MEIEENIENKEENKEMKLNKLQELWYQMKEMVEEVYF